MIGGLRDVLFRLADLGGPVVLILAGLSVLALAVILYKLWQFTVTGVGRHAALCDAVAAWDAGDRAAARAALARSTSYLKPVIDMAMSGQRNAARLDAEAETRFARLESGFRFLDTVAQISPLLGLFGTVLGMISAFQALQAAGAQVDPSILAGGIWVALLTTAAGLAVAMPTALALSWFEARTEAERIFTEKAVHTVLSPSGADPVSASVHGASAHA
ncbi:MotA/TolQ/ExbB proton channel family protein [Aquicoccus sp. SU-CL01552]|uniref:MotA/TolQ/ExbB proton channel family protein n=1 Tax=Aquicoccus sp. SU-CL01552 TaxID=3127656 RepID=UPI00310BECD3